MAERFQYFVVFIDGLVWVGICVHLACVCAYVCVCYFQHLGRMAGLMGLTEEETTKVDML